MPGRRRSRLATNTKHDIGIYSKFQAQIMIMIMVSGTLGRLPCAPDGHIKDLGNLSQDEFRRIFCKIYFRKFLNNFSNLRPLAVGSRPQYTLE
jgi:hypothetical protein